MSSVECWRRRARRRLPRFVFDYIEGGADHELTMARNVAALRRTLLLPERFTDTTHTDTETTLFGVRQSCPLIVAPTGLNGLVWPQGDIALARAATRLGIPFVLSTASTSSIEEVAAASTGTNWFQLYVLEDRRIAEQLMMRADAAGYRVLVLTLDVPINGNRLRDQRNGFSHSSRLTARTMLDVLRHPRWLVGVRRSGAPAFGNFRVTGVVQDPQASRALLQRTMARSLTWNCIDWLRAHWRGPIVLKGILSASDAERACECGVDGIVVSNHGGRQLDCVPATIEVLEAIAARVAQRLTVLADSGFRSGSDVIRALALGAKAVLIGRPVLYGLAAAGEAGAWSVLESLQQEIERTMVLAGYQKVTALAPHHVTRAHE